MGRFLPDGALGVALAGLLAAYMAGMAANVSSFNTVFTYDIWQTYIRRGRRDRYYLNVGRVVTAVGILIGIGTAFIASGYSSIMNYIQLLFSFFNAPLFATFILAMFWKRTTPWSGIAGPAGAELRAVSSWRGRTTSPGYRPALTSRPTPGARGRAAYPGMLLGSVAEYCVRNGPCPVVVVRTPAK
jgi:solute:Na+ symporter, SSS family